MTEAILNLSCYKFTPLDDLEARREVLREACARHGLKGTVLLAPEGINFFLAGTRTQLAAVLEVLRAMRGWPTSPRRRARHRTVRSSGCS